MIQKNFQYIIVVFVGVILVGSLFISKQDQVSFYGIADTKEIEINYNVPVLIKELYVQSGTFVTKGTPLVGVIPVQTKAESDISTYKIEEVKAQTDLWMERKNNDVIKILASQKINIQKIDQQILKLENQQIKNNRIINSLESLDIKTDTTVSITQTKINMLNEQRKALQHKYQVSSQAIKQEKELGSKPFSKKIDKISAEFDLNKKNESNLLTINAPVDGIVGDIFCKNNTYFKEFSKLMNFYESNPDIIRGYVHENSRSEVKIGDVFEIESSTNTANIYKGKVIGLGSRIIVIPERLRKIPSVKIYGREINIAINTEKNALLQKERVTLKLIPSED